VRCPSSGACSTRSQSPAGVLMKGVATGSAAAVSRSSSVSGRSSECSSSRSGKAPSLWSFDALPRSTAATAASSGALRRAGSAARLGSVGALALSGGIASGSSLAALAQRERLQADRNVRLVLTIESDFDVACWVSLDSGEVEGEDLPIIISGGVKCEATYMGEAEGISGSLVPEGFRDGIPFVLRPASSDAFVGQPGRLRSTVTVPGSSRGGGIAPDEVSLLPAAAVGSPGVTVELRLTEDGVCSQLFAHIRLATESEARRAASQAS